MPDRFLKLRDVIAMTSLSRSTIYRRMDQSTFPRPVTISEACVRWRESDIQSWMGQFNQRAS